MLKYKTSCMVALYNIIEPEKIAVVWIDYNQISDQKLYATFKIQLKLQFRFSQNFSC